MRMSVLSAVLAAALAASSPALAQTVQQKGPYATLLEDLKKRTQPIVASIRQLAEDACPTDKTSAIGSGCRALFETHAKNVEIALTTEVGHALAKWVAGDPNPNEGLDERIKGRLDNIGREVKKLYDLWKKKRSG